MHNIDFSILDELLTNKKPKLLGNISLLKNDTFDDMTDVMDFLNTLSKSKDKIYRSEIDMIEAHFLQNQNNCPQIIKDISKDLKKFNPFKNCELDVVGFIGLNNAIGYDWHYDYCHLIAMNIIGETTWHFKNGDTIKMTPGDLMFVPSPVEHKVVGTTERFTISFCCPI
jgi:hypothetical protein